MIGHPINRHRARERTAVVRWLWRFTAARMTAPTLAKRIRGRALGLQAELLDGLLRRGDRLADEVARTLAARLGSELRADPVLNPSTAWHNSTGRLRGIRPGASGMRHRARELAAEARAAGYRVGAEPSHWTLEGALAGALAAYLDLRGAKRRLEAGVPINSLRGASRPSTI